MGEAAVYSGSACASMDHNLEKRSLLGFRVAARAEARGSGRAPARAQAYGAGGGPNSARSFGIGAVTAPVGWSRFTKAAFLATFLTLIIGCAAPKRGFHPEQDPDALSATSFLHYLPTVPVASLDEGFRAVLILADQDSACHTFKERRARLLELGAFRSNWSSDADVVLDKGTFAYMLRTLCDMPPSLCERLFCPIGLGLRRYALKTCVHTGVLADGLPYEPIGGGELLGAISGAEAYLESRASPSP